MGIDHCAGVLREQTRFVEDADGQHAKHTGWFVGCRWQQLFVWEGFNCLMTYGYERRIVIMFCGSIDRTASRNLRFVRKHQQSQFSGARSHH
jgi:hypothetical protein